MATASLGDVLPKFFSCVRLDPELVKRYSAKQSLRIGTTDAEKEGGNERE